MSLPDDLGVEIMTLAACSVLLAIAFQRLLTAALHRPATSGALLAFSSATTLYAVYALSQLALIRTIAPLPENVWEHIAAVSRYLQPVAAFLFVEQHWGPGWRSAFRRIWQTHLAYATVAVAVDIAAGAAGTAVIGHLLLVMLWMFTVLGHVAAGRLLSGAEDGVVRTGLLVLVVSIVNDVLIALDARLPWSLQIIPMGILCLAGCLDHTLMRRTIASERRLATLNADLQTARQIQQSLLPRTGPPAGACAVRYRPMDTVAGDLYDFLPVAAQRFGVMVADVSGHGIPAAIIASMVKTGLSSQAHRAHEPGAVLAGMNRHVYGQLDDNFITVVYAYVDLAARRVTVANAGHPPPLLLSRSQRTATRVEGFGPALGIVPDVEYETTQVPMALGDRLVLYSDGVVEASSPAGADFTIERLRTTLLAHAAESAERWADEVLRQLRRWIDKPTPAFEDDVTLVVLDLLETPGRGADVQR